MAGGGLTKHMLRGPSNGTTHGTHCAWASGDEIQSVGTHMHGVHVEIKSGR